MAYNQLLTKNAIPLTLFGAKGDGATNDYAAIMRAHDNAPLGSTIVLSGAFKFTTALVFTRRLNWVCLSQSDYFYPAVGAGNDAITIGADGAIMNDVTLRLNVLGPTNSCRNGVVLKFVMNCPEISINAMCGAAEYGVKLLGSETNQRIYINICVNYFQTLASAALPANHIFIPENTTGYGFNANDIFVNLAGGGNGVTIGDQLNQGDNRFSGTIQGITGAPFTVTGCQNLSLDRMHLEANSAASVFTSCTSLALENLNAAGDTLSLIGCRDSWLNEGIGSIVIDSTSLRTRIGAWRLSADDTIANSSISTETLQGSGLDSTALTADGGSGSVTCGPNIFQNPFVDIWSAGAASAPDGFSGAAVSYARNTGTVWSGNPVGVSVAVTSTSVVVTSGAELYPAAPYLVLPAERWISAFGAVYVATGQPNLFVYCFDGSGYRSLATVTTKDAWVEFRGSCKIPAGNTFSIVFRPNNGAFVAGNYFIGGCSIVNGTVSPRYLVDDGMRLQHVVTAVGYTPALMGQRAYIAGTGKWYMAAATASSADWIILN